MAFLRKLSIPANIEKLFSKTIIAYKIAEEYYIAISYKNNKSLPKPKVMMKQEAHLL